MKLAVALLSILVGCEAGAPPVANPTPLVANSTPAGRRSADQAGQGRKARGREADRHRRGGLGPGRTHFTVEVDEPGARSFVHGGGHGFALVPFGREPPPMGYYIAEILPSVKRFRVWDGGWGVGNLPTYTGVVLHAVPVDDRAEAFRLLPSGFDRVDRCAILDLTVDLPRDAYEVPQVP